MISFVISKPNFIVCIIGAPLSETFRSPIDSGSKIKYRDTKPVVKMDNYRNLRIVHKIKSAKCGGSETNRWTCHFPTYPIRISTTFAWQPLPILHLALTAIFPVIISL